MNVQNRRNKEIPKDFDVGLLPNCGGIPENWPSEYMLYWLGLNEMSWHNSCIMLFYSYINYKS